MDPTLQKHLIDKLRNQMTLHRTSNRSPSCSNLKSPKNLPNIHKRSTTDSHLKTEVISRDVSHRMDGLSKVKSTSQFQEIKLKEILGMKPKNNTLPQDLRSLETYVSRKSKKIGHKKIFQELHSMKLKISKQKEKLLKKIVDEGGLLYRTQTGILLPQLSSMYESLLKKIADSKGSLPRGDLDLGNPSGRKEVEIIIAWLENMIMTYVNQVTDITLEEKVRRASMIYTVCFKEVVRQVSNHCIERGILLQKIWNAQIDIYCAKEDEKVQKIEEIQTKFENVMKEYEEKYKSKAKMLEGMLKSAKEAILEKENEINIMKGRIDDLKVQYERDRRNLIMNFSKPTVKKQELGEYEEEIQLNHNKLEAVKPKVPVVLIGYFDFNGSFHKKKAIQYVQGKRHENNVEDIIKIYEFTSTNIGNDDFSEYLLENGYSSNFSSQYPEEIHMEISLQSQISIQKPEKVSLKVYGKSRKSQKTYRLSVYNHLQKPRSTSVMVDKFNFLKPRSANVSRVSSRSQSRSQSRKSSKESSHNSSRKSSRKSRLEISTDIKIVEHKVLTPTDFKKNKIFKKILEEKLNVLKEGDYQSTNIRKNSYFNNLSNRKSSINEESSESDDDSSANSSVASQEDLENSTKSRPSLVPKAKNKPRGYSTILSPRSGKISMNNKNIRKSVNEDSRKSKYLKSINFNLKTSEIRPDGKIAASPRYTIIKTPPLSSSSEGEKNESNESIEIQKDVGDIEDKKEDHASKGKETVYSVKESKIQRKNEKIGDKEKGSKNVKNEKTVKSDKKGKKKNNGKVKNDSNNGVPGGNKREDKVDIENRTKSIEVSQGLELREIENDEEKIPNERALSFDYGIHNKAASLVKYNSSEKIEFVPSKSPTSKNSSKLSISKPASNQSNSNKPTPKNSISKDSNKSNGKSQSFSGFIPSKRSSSSIYSHLEKHVSEIDNNPLLKTFIFEKLRSAKNSTDLQEILKNLIPEDLSPVPSVDFKDKSIQTDDLTDNFLSLSYPKKPNTKELKLPKPIRRKSFSKTELIKSSPNMPNSSKVSSLNTSGLIKTDKSRLKKLQLDEFNLGIINKKLVLNHPGQKLFYQIIENLKSNHKNPKISLKTLMKTIQLVYQEKLNLDKENGNYYKTETSMILFDLLMHKYGLKNVAEEHFAQIVQATLFYRDKVLRVSQFSQFLGCDGESVLEDWNFYCRILELVSNFSYGKSTATEDSAKEHFCNFAVAIQVVHALFDSKLSESEVEDLVNQVGKIKIEGKQSVSKRTSDQKIVENVNLEEFYKICEKSYLKIKEKIKEKFWPDISKDDYVNEEEFVVFCRKFRFSEPEPFSKIFEKYSVLQKVEDDKVQKMINIRSACAIVFENSLCDCLNI